MDQDKRKWFLYLVLVQGIHSLEEYIGELWLNFPPARISCGMISDNLELGFLVINIGLFLFGIATWLVANSLPSGLFQSLIIFWVTIEIINGVGHPIWSLIQRSYTPGLITAPILLLIALKLLQVKMKSKV